MSTITGQNLVDRCADDLKDPNNVAWPEALLLQYLNDATKTVVNLRPDSYMTTSSVVLVAGTKQAIPSNGHRLVRINRNMGTNGTTPGRVINLTTMESMDRSDPDWHTETASATVDNYLKYEDPKIFYVTPPQPASGFGYVEISYSIAPTAIVIGAVILVEDTYANAIYYYMMARAHAKEDLKADSAKVAGFMAMFKTELGVESV